jgi:hypothetical protein
VSKEVPGGGREAESPELLHQEAFHARVQARAVQSDAERKRLNDHADELDARARAIERRRG